MNNKCWIDDCKNNGFIVWDGKSHCFSCWSNKVAKDFNADQKFLLFIITSKILETSRKRNENKKTNS